MSAAQTKCSRDTVAFYFKKKGTVPEPYTNKVTNKFQNSTSKIKTNRTFYSETFTDFHVAQQGGCHKVMPLSFVKVSITACPEVQALCNKSTYYLHYSRLKTYRPRIVH